jgi:chromosomal replication initiation ATPase DnaA
MTETKDVKEGDKLQETQIQMLLKSIVRFLKSNPVPELTEMILTSINKRDDIHSSEKYILDLVCETYKVSNRALIYGKSNRTLTKPRQVAFCLLYFTLGLSIRYIAKDIFKLRHHSAVGDAIKRYKNLDTNIKPDREFKKSIEILRDKIVEKMQNQSINN